MWVNFHIAEKAFLRSEDLSSPLGFAFVYFDCPGSCDYVGIHAALIVALSDWLDSIGIHHWSAEDEFSGKWHYRTHPFIKEENNKSAEPFNLS